MTSYKKIAVLAMPRTGATKQCLLTMKSFYDVEYYGELLSFELDDLDQNVVTLNSVVSKNQDLVVKIFPSNFSLGTVEQVAWDKFDVIYTVHRKSLADQLLSTIVATKSNQWIRQKSREWTPFADTIFIEDTVIDDFVIMLGHRDLIDAKIIQIVHDKVKKVYYEEIVDTELRSPDSTVIPTNYDYHKLCDNYMYVANKIANQYKGQ